MKLPLDLLHLRRVVVAPCAGAWIEISMSAASRSACAVAPCAGAWIEICIRLTTAATTPCRPLRGGVD